MRRGSIIGPLILIVLGGMFLANNIKPDWSLVETIGRYWPYILITWGVLRLLEILFLATRRRPLPASGISGGEWLLIVFIGLVGSGMAVASRHWTWFGPMNVRVHGVEVFGDTHDYPLAEQKIAATGVKRVVIENWRGNARVVVADAAEVKVTGHKTVRSMRREDAEEEDRRTPVELTQQGDSIFVRTNQERARHDRFVASDLDIVVPRGVSVEGRGRHGDFDITGINGDVDISSDNAAVRVQTLGGNLRIDLRRSDIVRALDVSGNVEVKGRGDDIELENIQGTVNITGAFGGEVQFRNLAKSLRIDGMRTDVRIERVPGSVRLGRGYLNAQNVVGPIVINGQSKDIEIEEFTNSLELTIDKGDVELRPANLPLSKMDVSTHSGRIDLALPDNAKFSLRATTNKGEVENAFGDVVRVSEEGRGAVMTASVSGGPSLVLNTDRGSIAIRRSSEMELPAPLTPQPPPRPPRMPARVE